MKTFGAISVQSAKQHFRNLRKQLKEKCVRLQLRRLLPRKCLAEAQRTNRLTLSKVENWISDETYFGSVFRYGMPPEIRPRLNWQIGTEMTYTDALLCLARTSGRPIRYLEIGVSAGKNFTQVFHGLENCSVTGFDIEDINPVIEKFLTRRAVERWPAPSNSIRKSECSVTEYDFTPSNNKVRYICGDVFDQNAWNRLRGHKFDLVFSDALHSGEALRFEADMLNRLDLLADDLTFFWDDLWDGEMREAFDDITSELIRRRPGRKNLRLIAPLRGWQGIHEDHHPVGIFISGGRT